MTTKELIEELQDKQAELNEECKSWHFYAEIIRQLESKARMEVVVTKLEDSSAYCHDNRDEHDFCIHCQNVDYKPHAPDCLITLAGEALRLDSEEVTLNFSGHPAYREVKG